MKALGYDAMWDKAASEMPGTAEFSQESQVRIPSIRLLNDSDGKYLPANFFLTLYANTVAVVSGNSDIKFDLSNASMCISDLCGVVKCKGSGMLRV